MPHIASLLALGFALGMRHSTDPDHVVAVSTIVAREKRLGPACVLGMVWGVGHTVTIFAVGVAIIFLKLAVPARVGLSMELAVGLMLVLLGALNIAGRGVGALGVVEHEHVHDHGDADHRHEHPKAGPHSHVHAHALTFGWLERPGHAQLWRSLLVGLVHGLAGSAAVALLVLATIAEPRAAAAYLLVFGLGTLAGMLAISAAMEASMLVLVRRGAAFARALTLGTGLLSLAFGAWVVYRIGFVDGLFLAQPHWTPQ
jgi:high-affinity nickel-transport protein